MSTRVSKARKAEAIEKLREILRPGDTVVTILRHVSASGMYRSIDAYRMESVDEHGELARRWLSRLVADLGIGRWDDRRKSVGMSGAGMDMGFQLVYVLSHELFPQGFECIGEQCPSNDHSNGMPRPHLADGGYLMQGATVLGVGDAPPVPHHANGGYALHHSWFA